MGISRSSGFSVLCGLVSAFLSSIHCTSRMHCPTCRDLTGGRSWRSSLQGGFDDLPLVDFPCPAGLPWLETQAPAGGFEEVSKEIRAAPAEGFWIDLKEELRLLEAFLALHASRSPCWKRRQMARLVGFYHVARAKSGA